MRRTLHRSNRWVAPICVMMLAMGTVGCGIERASPSTESPPVSTAGATREDRVFVLPETVEFTVLDSQRAATAGQSTGPMFFTFALSGSPDDDIDGPRVMVGIADVADTPTNDVVSGGTKIVAGGRPFRWISDAEDQRVYVGSTPLGSAIAMTTLNVDEADAVDLLAGVELIEGAVSFDGAPVPDGWVDTGTSTTQLQFLAGSTGSATPIGGTRTLYGAASDAETQSSREINGGFGVTLASWPVTGSDPVAEARYSLDGEVDVQVRLADGSSTVGFASPPGSEFFEFVVWQAGPSWLALSRPANVGSEALADLAATIRAANANESDRLDSLQED